MCTKGQRLSHALYATIDLTDSPLSALLTGRAKLTHSAYLGVNSLAAVLWVPLDQRAVISGINVSVVVAHGWAVQDLLKNRSALNSAWPFCNEELCSTFQLAREPF